MVGAGRRRARRQTLLNRLSILQRRKLREIGIALGNGDIDAQRYTIEMTHEIETEHVAAAAIYRRGLDELTTQDNLVVRSRLNSELGYLGGLVVGWVGGTVTQGRLASRSQQYGAAVRPTYYAVGTADLRSEGFELERNLLSPVDNCEGTGSCIQETQRGFVTVGELIPIGNRLCLSNCQCQAEYVTVAMDARVVL